MSRRHVALRVLASALLAGVCGVHEATPAVGEVIAKRGSVDGRAYRLYVPAVVAESPGEQSPRPLVIALHGCWQTPEDFVMTTRLAEAAERRGLLVVVPAQGRRDNPSRCWNWFIPEAHSRARGETAQILAIAAEVRREYRIAREQVVVIGFSAGGYMAVNLACQAPDVVSGVGVVSGGPYRCGVGPLGAVNCMRGLALDGEAAAVACRTAMGPLARPLRASLWQGADDPVVNPANLKALSVMFAQLDGARAPKAEPGGALVYRDQAGRPMVQAWLIEGMGHAWSGGDPRGTHAYPHGPNTTDAMLDFLLGRE
jgi:poly(hydroxyalkanoate) depolymerase family esterase